MTGRSPSISLAHAAPLTPSSGHGGFVLQVRHPDSSGVSISIRQADSDSALVEWRGAIARHLLDKHPLAQPVVDGKTRALNKDEVKALTLAAAGRNMAAAQWCTRMPKGLETRLSSLGVHLPPLHQRMAALLFEHPGKHFEQADAVCAVLLHHPMVCEARLVQALDQLADWQVLQRIDLGDKVFYDIDTSPHLHVYCEHTQQLFDAPSTGVLRSNSRSG